MESHVIKRFSIIVNPIDSIMVNFNGDQCVTLKETCRQPNRFIVDHDYEYEVFVRYDFKDIVIRCEAESLHLENSISYDNMFVKLEFYLLGQPDNPITKIYQVVERRNL